MPFSPPAFHLIRCINGAGVVVAGIQSNDWLIELRNIQLAKVVVTPTRPPRIQGNAAGKVQTRRNLAEQTDSIGNVLASITRLCHTLN